MNNTSPFPLSVNAYSQAEVVINTLYTVEETRQALQLLQERKVVILNLEHLTVDQAQRVVDWMAGGTCAIDGQTFWVGEKTFMFVPNQVYINSNRASSSSVVPFLKTGEEKLPINRANA